MNREYKQALHEIIEVIGIDEGTCKGVLMVTLKYWLEISSARYRLAVVRKEAELPKNPYTRMVDDLELVIFDTAQKSMLEAGFVQEIKEKA